MPFYLILILLEGESFQEILPRLIILDLVDTLHVPFVLPTAELDAAFIKEATAKGFANLKGHRSVGGMRASIYNAMPTEGVRALVELMGKFEVENK